MDSAAPTFSLSRFVEDIRAVVPVAGRSLDVERLPDGRTTLVFRVMEDGRSGDVSVAGPRTRAHFKNATGVARAGPKDFARTVRLQRAVRRAATSKDWASIAADAGYYDQAHLIADFRELVGLTPGAFLKRQRGDSRGRE